MPSARAIRAALILALVASGGATVAEAQQAPCRYDTCALRLKFSGMGSRKIVAGDAATPADRGGVWSRPVPALEAGSDSVRFHHREYRTHATRGGWLSVLGAVNVSVGLSLDYNDHEAWTIGLVSSGLILEVIGAVNRSRSEEHLQRAIWLYNRDLPQ